MHFECSLFCFYVKKSRVHRAAQLRWWRLSILVLPSCPYSSVGKESACNAGYPSSIPGLGSSPGVGNGKPLQYYNLENPMDRGAWQATVRGVPRVGHDLANKPLPPLLP